RCLSDWSSDVCSSDLKRVQSHRLFCLPNQSKRRRAKLSKKRPLSSVTFISVGTRRTCATPTCPCSTFSPHSWAAVAVRVSSVKRSEERRVGKECGEGW